MKLILSLLLLLPPVFSQALVEPVRVAIKVSQRDQYNRDLDTRLRAELNKLRYVAVVSGARAAHFDVYVVTAPIAEEIGCVGFSAAMVVISRRGTEVSIHTGRSPEQLAGHLAGKLEREFFKREKR
jgi:hypothetical protein